MKIALAPLRNDMADQSPSERYKAEMPQIPGVNSPGGRRSGFLAGVSPAARLAGGLVLVLVIGFFAARLFMRPKRVEQAEPDSPPQIVVPAPSNDASAAPPVATEASPGIATLSELATPWTAKEFSFRNGLTAENIPALIVRLPGTSASQGSGYWAFSLKAPYGSCQLEYVTDLGKLSSDYGFHPKHPMVGNPCSRTLYDPLRLTNLPGNVWVRGAIAQGSDIRPPIGIEIQIRGKEILATRME